MTTTNDIPYWNAWKLLQPGSDFKRFTISLRSNCALLIRSEKNDTVYMITIQNVRMRMVEYVIFAGTDNRKAAGNGTDEIHRTGVDGAMMWHEKKIAFQIVS